MTKSQKYLEAIKSFDECVIVSEWATRVGKLYPNLLEIANQKVANQANETTGLKELAARISYKRSSGGFPDVEVDDSERPRAVRYISATDKQTKIDDELEADIEPLTRTERIRSDFEKFTEIESTT